MKTADEKQRFVELRAKGYSFDRIAKEIGVSKPTLISWVGELELDIANYKAIEREALQEKYHLTRKCRLEALGKELERIKQEVEKRNISDVPTEKLYDLMLRLYDKAKEEADEVEISQRVEQDLEGMLAESMNSVSIKKYKV